MPKKMHKSLQLSITSLTLLSLNRCLIIIIIIMRIYNTHHLLPPKKMIKRLYKSKNIQYKETNNKIKCSVLELG